jgi:hypothetical protein
MTVASRTETFSARWRTDVVARLKRRSESAGVSKSRLAERYVDEGTRMDEHPGIVFRGGPSGRRAALAAGPDVWEVLATLKSGEKRGQEAIAPTAELLSLTEPQVRAAVRYDAAFPEEIDERIARNADDADEAEEAWRREQAAIA